MAKWVTKQLTELLHQINDVPYDDNRESRQLTILMNGFAQLNNKVMEKAAAKTREQMRGWSLDDAVEEKSEKKKTPEELADEANAELTKLRPLR